MKKRKKWIKWAVLLVLVVLAVLALRNFGKKSEAASYKEETVVSGDLQTYYNFDGLVKAKRTQTIAAQEAGTVRTIYVQQNEQVRKGQRLYRMENGEAVEADIAGEVTGLYIETDGVIAAGEKTVQIIDMDSLEVSLNVDEYDVAAVTIGKPVDIDVLAADSTFSGTVKSLDKNGTASGDLSYYTATIALEGTAAEGVYPGMQVSAKMLRASTENATLVKMDAVKFDEYNKPYVLMRSADGQNVVNVPVEVGMNDGIYCEILSGVKVGDTVLKQSGMTMAELMEQMRSQSATTR